MSMAAYCIPPDVPVWKALGDYAEHRYLWEKECCGLASADEKFMRRMYEFPPQCDAARTFLIAQRFGIKECDVQSFAGVVVNK